jgi:lysyl-tRNA synthetase class 2
MEKAGIRLELIPILHKLGINSISQMREMKASKLFNDVCGMRKKLKLENVQNPTIEEVEGWIK